MKMLVSGENHSINFIFQFLFKGTDSPILSIIFPSFLGFSFLISTFQIIKVLHIISCYIKKKEKKKKRKKEKKKKT
jgi:hypothetical protein